MVSDDFFVTVGGHKGPFLKVIAANLIDLLMFCKVHSIIQVVKNARAL